MGSEDVLLGHSDKGQMLRGGWLWVVAKVKGTALPMESDQLRDPVK